MDDRFKSEFGSTEKSGNINYSANQNSLGDFSENISSAGSIPNGMPVNSASQAKRFQVHLPDFVDDIPDFSSFKPEPEFKTVSGSEYIRSKSYEPVNTAKPDLSAQTTPAQKFSPAENSSPKAPQTEVNTDEGTDVSGDTRIIKTPLHKGVKASASQSGKGTLRRPVAKNGAAVKSDSAKRSQKKKVISKKKKANFTSSLLVACICLVFIGIFTVTASTVALDTINDILAIEKDSSESITVYIPEDATDYNDIFPILEESGFIKQPFFTDFFLKYRHYDEKTIRMDNDTPGDTSDDVIKTVRVQYEPGIYYFDEDMGIETIFDSIKVSSSSSRDSVTLTFPEGWSTAKIFAKLEKYGVCTAEKLYANLDLVAKQYSFMKGIEEDPGRYLLAEGYLFPDTYDFYINENATSVLKKLFNNFDKRWEDEYADRLKELGMTMDEVITIASIIQREASGASQMGIVSSVIHNRLKNSATFPTLGFDSTKDYIISIQNDYKVFDDFYFSYYSNSYNTYSVQGLPPGPICNPGLAAIKAALYPEESNYFYFCHDTAGAIYLATTHSEHINNKQKVLGD